MNNETSATSAQVSGFSLTITGDQSPDRPELLGRDIRYVLNVKAIGQDGQVVEGVRYRVNCDIPSNSIITFPGRGEGQISTAAGENFSIYGIPAPNASYHLDMNTTLHVIVTSSDDVSTQVDYRMGRLCYWATPYVWVGPHGDWLLYSHTEWAGEGTAAQWTWSRNVPRANLNIPSKGIETSLPTYDSASTGPVKEGPVRMDFSLDREVFTEGERIRVFMPSSWNDWTATLPYEGEFVVRPK